MTTRPPDTAGRLRRLLAILAWLAPRDEAPVDELAERFGLSPAELVAELELAACCGVPPYSPDQLLEIVVTDETVSVRAGESLARPRRLTPGEGLALAASARALLAVPGSDGDGALARAVAKLDQALGGDHLAVDLDAPDHLAVVRDAVEAGSALDLTYYSASTDDLGRRTVFPWHLFAADGHWYLDGWCASAGGERRFRVDRIRAAAPVDDPWPDPATAGRTEVADSSDRPTVPFLPGPDARPVRLTVDPGASWLLEGLPGAVRLASDGDGDRWEVFVSGEAWLERLLLRLGPTARLEEPAAWRGMAATAAARVLERYRNT